MAGDKDMVANDGAAWNGTRPNRAHMLDRAIGTDPGSGMNPDFPGMRY
jgi:hypothetical protein